MTPIILVGPTGSGKSKLALSLAQKYKLEIINADAMQLYRDLSVLTDRPDESAFVPHHLYGILESDKNPNAAWWAKKAIECIKKTPSIVVGGTGFYINTLIFGISPIPEIDIAVKEFVRNLSNQKRLETLKKIDPLAASIIHPCHTSRLVRALEVFLQTRKSIIEWHKEPKKPLLNDYHYLVLAPSKNNLHQRIDARVLRMINRGAIEEVRNLNVTEGQILKAIGVLELKEVLLGNLSLQSAIELIQLKTKQYAKRQRTWFKTQSPSIKHVVFSENVDDSFFETFDRNKAICVR